MEAASVPDIDIYVLKHMYDYAGHLARVADNGPRHLTSQVLSFRDAQWRQTMTTLYGHQGHHGRVAPWLVVSGERQHGIGNTGYCIGRSG